MKNTALQLITAVLISLTILSANSLTAMEEPNICKANSIASLEEMLDAAMGACSEIKDYKGIFTRQERIDSKLNRVEVIEFKFKNEPFSLLMNWKEGSGKIDKLLYVAGKFDNQMLVHPTGKWSWVSSVKKEPDCKEVKESCLRTCTDFGFENMVKMMKDALGNRKMSEQKAYITTFDNSECAVYEIKSNHASLPGEKKVIVYFNLENNMPVALYGYGVNDRLLYSYEFTNLKFNVDISEVAFAKKTNKM